MSEKRNVPITRPSLGEDEWLAVREPLESGWLTQGPKVAEFEQAFAARHEVPHALATTSCTTALHLALAALDIGPGDEVIVPAFTWIATANVVVYVGATPVFVDVDPATYNLDPSLLAGAVTERTRAVIPVHLSGLCADMDAIRSAAPDLPLVEDAACAAGASYQGRPSGGLGDAACFSFHPRKSVTTGEGGMLTTTRPDLAERAERLRNHGAGISEEARHRGAAPYLLPDFDDLGFNYRMPDLLAAIGVVQLSKLDRFVAERDQWARFYTQELGQLGWFVPPVVPDGYGHAWQAYVAVLGPDAPCDRDSFLAHLHDRGIGARPGTHAPPGLGYYRKHHGTSLADYPVADMLQAQTVAIPLHNSMTADDYHYVVEVIRSLD